MADQPSITCPRCGMTSYHPEDIRQGYCGGCHWWTTGGLLAEFVSWEAPPDPPSRWRRFLDWLGVGPSDAP